MKPGLFPVILTLVVVGWASVMSGSHPDPVRVGVDTTAGEILIEVDPAVAPITVANFLKYVDAGSYDGGSFFRTVHMQNQPADSIRIEVIQGGANRERTDGRFDPIPLERTNATGLRHLDGTVSMARGGPDTARDSFFICIGDQPSLDYGGMRNPDGQGFAAFGQVISGMDVVRAIQGMPADGQTLTEPVVIRSVRRVEP